MSYTLGELCRAIHTNDLNLVKIIIATQPELLQTHVPVKVAFEHENKPILNILIEAGADSNTKIDGISLLVDAASKGNIEDVKFLLEHGANINDAHPKFGTPLFVALDKNHTDVALELLQHKPNLEIPCGEYKITALHKAAMRGNAFIVNNLLAEGANIEARSTRGVTPLGFAVVYGQEPCVRELLDRGADINARSIIDSTPLGLAHRYEQDYIANLLLERGASVDFCQNWLDKQLITYIKEMQSHDPTHYPELAVTALADLIKRGMCRGFTLFWLICSRPKSQLSHRDAIERISSWDGKIDSLEKDPALQLFFESAASELLLLQQSMALTNADHHLRLFELLNMVDDVTWQVAYKIGFVFKVSELQELLELLHGQEAVFESASLGHSIGADVRNNGVFFDSNGAWGPIADLSAKQIAKKMKVSLFDSNRRIGISMQGLNQKDTKTDDVKFNDVISHFMDKLIAKRIKSNELNLTDHFGANSLVYAILANDDVNAEKLINAGIEFNCKESPIVSAARTDNLKILQKVFEAGGSIEDCADKCLPTYMAALFNHPKVLTFLINHGAKIEDGDETLQSPLYIAACKGYMKVVQILIAAGANINSKNESNGATPLYGAAYYGHKEVAERLLKAGADPHEPKSDPPLYEAIKNGQLNIVRLYAHLPNFNWHEKFEFGYTPLQVAQYYHQDAIAAYIEKQMMQRICSIAKFFKSAEMFRLAAHQADAHPSPQLSQDNVQGRLR